VSALERLNESVAPLVARARRGDTAAFAEVVEACRPLIYRWSVVVTGDLDEAEDVTQEVLVRLHRSLPRYRVEARFTTWLYRITQNAARDRLRSRRRRQRLVLETEPVTEAHDAGAAGRVLEAELGLVVRRFLASLPERQRQIFDLVDLQDHTPTEAAKMLGLDAGTARAHLHRARRTIRSRVLAHHPELAQGTGS
jgi:RNA polymerase sigma-70 factor (ECF subfamily)